MKYFRFIFLSILPGILLSSCQPQSQTSSVITPRSDWQKYYTPHSVSGVFVLYNLQKGQYQIYNPELKDSVFTPASTFKICNSIIGLETGVIPDTGFTLAWDGRQRMIPAWNKDHNLASAYRNSTVWYYQELARRVGKERMQYWLDTLQYGNANISSGIDNFWLGRSLRITPMEQIDFLKRLHLNELPCSQRSMDLTKAIMIAERESDYTLRAKTGWAIEPEVNTGWYVGYVEKGEDVYFFANCIQAPEAPENFATIRIDITRSILSELDIISEK